MQIYGLDWFETGIYCPFSDASILIEFIKKNLYFKTREGLGNPHYLESVRNDDFGFYCFVSPRSNLKNPPIQLRCTGSFFFCNEAYVFLDKLLKFVYSVNGYRFSFIRIDARVDFLSFSADEYFVPEPYRIEKRGKPTKIKAFVDWDLFKQLLENLKECRSLPFKDYSEAVDDLSKAVENFTCGAGDSYLRVYNKLLKLPNYLTAYGLNLDPEFKDKELFGVWRIEFEFKGKKLKGLEKKALMVDCESIFHHLMGQCHRRYCFFNFQYEPSLISSYFRTTPNAAHILQNRINKCLKIYREYDALAQQIGRLDNEGKEIGIRSKTHQHDLRESKGAAFITDFYTAMEVAKL